jgi:hypothetical protein
MSNKSQIRPPPVTGAQPGWARQSIIERLPAVLKQLERDLQQHAPNTMPRWLQLNRELAAEITGDHVLTPNIRTGPHVLEWCTHVSQLSSDANTWLTAPWYLVEVYFYRRLLDNTGYFHISRDQHAALPNMGADEIKGDPFGIQKLRSLNEAKLTIDTYTDSLFEIFGKLELKIEDFKHAIAMTLWGNKSDLSKNPHGISQRDIMIELDQGQEKLLIDHTTQIYQLLTLLQTHQSRHIAYVLDNSGLELFADLALLDVLSHFKLIDSVTIHCKYHPTFVSDVITEDIEHTLRWMEQQNDKLKSLATRWREYLTSKSGKVPWTVAENYYWNHYSAFWADMPHELKQELETASLVVIKGDMNTRRLHGDLRWPFTTNTTEMANYLQADLLLIRTLKSETASGLLEDQLATLSNDPSWLWSGDYGVIQHISNRRQNVM